MAYRAIRLGFFLAIDIAIFMVGVHVLHQSEVFMAFAILALAANSIRLKIGDLE